MYTKTCCSTKHEESIFITMLCNGSFFVVCSTVELNAKHKIKGKHGIKKLNGKMQIEKQNKK